VTLSLTLAWRYLRGRGARSLLTTLAVVFGVMLTFGLNGILPAMLEAFNRNLLSQAGKVDLTVTSAYNQPFDADVVQRLLGVPQVETASPGVARTAPLPREADAPADALAQVVVVGIDIATATGVHDFPVASGRLLGAADDAAAMLNADLAGELGLGLGDQLLLPAAGGSARFRVVGLLAAATVPGQETVYLTLPAAQRLFGLGQRITQVEAAFVAGADRATTERARPRSAPSTRWAGCRRSRPCSRRSGWRRTRSACSGSSRSPPPGSSSSTASGRWWPSGAGTSACCVPSAPAGAR
jgi:putative ABC transport system permease protein